MRFPSLKNNSKYFERSIKLNGGINTSSSPMIISENEVSESSNVVFEDSLLKTRKGFFTDENMLLNTLSEYEYIETPFSFLKETLNIENTEYKLGYRIAWDYVSYAKLNTFLVSSDGSFKAQSHIFFNRSDEATFLIPDTLTVFKGAKKYGSGIYIFCKTKNMGTLAGESDYRIYEMNSELTGWKRLFEDDYYIPTVYYNGRGNYFSESAVANDPLYEKPAELESQNLLTGSFYSYFSVDGSSDTFQLPLTELDDDPVVCNLTYKNGMSYNWIISGDSAEIDFLTTKVTAKCNRKKGTISFFQDDRAYPLPIYVKGSINNLKILASKKIQGEKASVLGAFGAINYRSNIIVYGSDEKPNKIFTASTENPLYFPKDSSLDVGVDGERITAVKTLGNSLVAFSSSSAYLLKLNEGDLVASTELISGVDKSFFKSDKFSCSLLNRDFGCPYPQSLSVVGDCFVFKSKYKIYTMNSSGRVYSVSYPISAANFESTDENYGAVAFNYNDYYCILIGSKIYLADIVGAKIKDGRKKATWFCWDLPYQSKLITAADFEGKPIFGFMCKSKNGCYLSKLYGNSDKALDVNDGIISLEEKAITAHFKTAFIELDSIKIESVVLEAGAVTPINILLDSYYSAFNTQVDLKLTDEEIKKQIYKKVTLYPSLKADTASIKIIGDAPFYLNRLKFLYR